MVERDLGATPLLATASLDDLVQLAHQRWAIEQQYQELKNELGLDHFEGRTLPGWQPHVALIAVAYTFLQVERQRRPSRDLTLPRVRGICKEFCPRTSSSQRPHYLKRILALQYVSFGNLQIRT